MAAEATTRDGQTADERMRIAELSKRSGVTVATIKYYLREGLLMPGELSSPNQAGYGQEHLRRLRMIRALIEVGGLSVAAVGDVFAAADGPERPTFELMGVVAGALDKPQPQTDDVEWARARAEVDAAFGSKGWNIEYRTSAIDTLVGVLVRMSQLGYGIWASEALVTYLDAAEGIAEMDVEHALRADDRADLIDGVAVMTILGEAALGAARRIAHIHVSARMLGYFDAPEADVAH
ncbi:MerR family transcriptional regulator [Nocardia sp. NPDC051756]|uniref:MerR family transcriptional regulator n=1 Tax=Nocardia sp. NPDC051756 TaxID=3154751 RepID=UPI00342BF294